MRQSVLSLIAFCLLSSTASYAVAQEKDSSQKPVSATSAETERPKSEVELMLEDAKKRGEPIMGTCLLEKCGENSDAKITDGVESGRALQLARPAYSPLARQAHASGEVRVQVIIDFDGKVIAASAISGHPLLQPACVTAARDTIFTPAKLEGKPVKVVGVLAYNFVSQ